MFYERDFARFRERINKLQIFSQKVHNHAERRETFQKFSDNFTLHGFSYIFYRNVHNFERYFWAICVVAAIITTIVVCSMLSSKYSDRTLITVIENSQYPVFNIEFPAIAICTKHRINWGRINQARRKFLPPNASNATVDMFESFVRRLDSFQFRTFDNFADLEKEPVHLLDSISITNLATYLAFRCEEILEGTCMWTEQPFDCCQMFVPEKTNMGMCLVFNSIVSEESRQKALGDPFYPYKNSKNGEGSGLVFTVKRNASNIVPEATDAFGIELMIKKPDQWTEGKTYHLRPKTNNGVMIKPETTKATEDLKAFPPSFRKCLFQHEKARRFFIPDLEYRSWNCKSQCHQDFLIRYCNCTIPLFFRIRGIQARECTASDYTCIYKNRGNHNKSHQIPHPLYKKILIIPTRQADVFSNDKQPNQEKFIKQLGRGMICPCPASCDSLTYSVTLNTVPIFNTSNVNMTTRVDIYYQSEVMMKYLATLKFTKLDLTGYFGGLVTLFLGASALTSFEILHFLLTILISYLEEMAQKRRMARKVKPRPT